MALGMELLLFLLGRFSSTRRRVLGAMVYPVLLSPGLTGMGVARLSVLGLF